MDISFWRVAVGEGSQGTGGLGALPRTGEGLGGFGIEGRRPPLRIRVESAAQRGGAGKGASTVAGSPLLPHWGQGFQLLAGDRSRKGAALWRRALFSLGPGGWG